jgi:uncharacterized membrane protein
MKKTRKVTWLWLMKKLRAQFITGIIITVPIGATILILIWVFNTIDHILEPLIMYIWGHYVSGIGFAATVILIYLVGVIASNVVGRYLIRYGESLLTRVPIVRPLYNGIKQILHTFSERGKSNFLQVVLVEFPQKGMKAMGFVTSEFSGKSGEKLLTVFIPHTPNPITGFLEIVREEDVIRTNISVDDAMKMVVSAGTASPAEIGEKFSKSKTGN